MQLFANLKVNFTNLAEGIQLPGQSFPILFLVTSTIDFCIFTNSTREFLSFSKLGWIVHVIHFTLTRCTIHVVHYLFNCFFFFLIFEIKIGIDIFHRVLYFFFHDRSIFLVTFKKIFLFKSHSKVKKFGKIKHVIYFLIFFSFFFFTIAISNTSIFILVFIESIFCIVVGLLESKVATYVCNIQLKVKVRCPVMRYTVYLSIFFSPSFSIFHDHEYSWTSVPRFRSRFISFLFMIKTCYKSLKTD